MKKIYKNMICLLLIQGFCFMNCTPNLPAHTSSFSHKKIRMIRKGTLTPKIGASQFSFYLPQIQNKKVGLVVNHTSLVQDTHIVDTLLSMGIDIKKVFAPEHGFRGDIDAGEHLSDSYDSKTGLPIISLYGKNKKPTAEQMADIEVLIFDIQDVGVRFYTYISTMHYVMEACAELDKEIIILDRPNPNGSYVDGPILDPKLKSFVGMHPIPIVHGLTIGELALMINGEGWLAGGKTCKLEVVPVSDYTHEAPYSLPVRPSPNLPNDLSITLYPSICLFEGTQISVGRGTEYPFQVIGAPFAKMGKFTFIPESIIGMSKNPKYQDKICYGKDFRDTNPKPEFTLQYLIEFYHNYPKKESFFNGYFDTLVGTYELQKQIKAGMSENEIRQTWQEGLAKYKLIREKYLLYN